jgi:TonB-dependent receptor
LKPVNSTNFDGSIEWYFSKVGSLTFSAFYKSLSDVLTNGTSVVPFTNGGQTYNVFVVTPVNAKEKGTVQGFELGYQQVYDFLPGFWSGFGIQANYTYIDSQGVPQSTLSNGTNDVGAGLQANVDTSLLPLQGLSKDNVNFAIFYEKGPISTRLAYNWRSKFLLTVRDVIVPYAPIFNEATGQLDGSFFYNVTDNVKIGLQGVNLLNEVTKTSQVLEVNEDGDALTAGRSWFVNDRRLSLVARVNF